MGHRYTQMNSFYLCSSVPYLWLKIFFVKKKKRIGREPPLSIRVTDV
jgi:hypothetical protein